MMTTSYVKQMHRKSISGLLLVLLSIVGWNTSYGQAYSLFTINGATFSVDGVQSDYGKTLNWSSLWSATYGGACRCDHPGTVSGGASGINVTIWDSLPSPSSDKLHETGIINPSTNGNGSWSKILGPNQQQTWYVEGIAYGSGCCGDIACTQGCTNFATSGTQYLLAQTVPLKGPSLAGTSGSTLSTITVNWTKGTNFPDDKHGYKIYVQRNQTGSYVLAATVPGDASNTGNYSHEIENLVAGTTYNISIHTYTTEFGGHESGGYITVDATLTPVMTATQGVHNNKIVLNWDNIAPGISDLRLKRSKPAGGFEEVIILNKSATAYNDIDAIPGYMYTYQLCPLDGNGNELNTFSTTGYRDNNGVIRGKIRALGGAGVQGVQVCAVPSTAVSPVGAEPVPSGGYCATTDASGNYVIRDVYYHDLASFDVTPSLSGHVFGPASQSVELDINAFTGSGIDFTDSSSVSVFGKVHFPPASQFGGTSNPGALIGVKDAVIKIDTIDLGVRSNKNGDWSYAVTSPGVVTFSVEYLHHSFDVMSRSVTVTDQDINNVDFVDQEIDSIKIRVQDGCGQPLAVFSNPNGSTPRVEITHALGSQLFQQKLNVDANGYITAILPGSQFEVIALDDPPFQDPNVRVQLQDTTFAYNLALRDTVELSIQDTTWTRIPTKTVLIGGQQVVIPGDTSFIVNEVTQKQSIQPRADFVYYGPFDITVDFARGGAEIFKGCTATGIGSATDSIILMGSGVVYPLFIRVVDKFSGCPVDTGNIVLYDFVGDKENTPQSIPLKNGQAFYPMLAAQPNIASGGSFPYQKALYFTVNAGTRPPEAYGNWIMVRGGRDLTPTFTSRSPEFPNLIIHDPPGDNSYAWVEKGSSYEYREETQIEIGGSGGTYVDATLGVSSQFFIGLGYADKTDINVGVRSTFSIDGGRTTNDNFALSNTISFTENFSTSSDPLFTGHEGDVYIGKAMNQLYSLAKVLEFDPTSCTTTISDKVNLEAVGVASTFTYTEKHVKGVLVPQLDYLQGILRDQAANESDPQIQSDLIAEADSFGMDIINWENILAQNAYNRDTGAVFKENRSFSAGATYQATTTYDSTTSSSFDYVDFVNVNTSIGAIWDVKAKIWAAGNAGFAAGFRHSFSRDSGNVENSNFTVGYQLADEDIGDFFSVDILTDTAFGVPAFRLFGGTSSCPHEAGTQQRDKAKLNIFPPRADNVPLGEKALMTAQLINESESQETREYHVRVIPQTNPDGAVINLGGFNINNRPASFFLDAFESKEIVLEVAKGPIAANYENIGIMMYPPCEYSLWEDNGNLTSGDTFYISVNFQTECSPVTLVSPVNNWLVNANNNNVLLVDFGGYDQENQYLESLTLEYKPFGQAWRDGPTVEKANFQGALHRILWDVSNLTDGKYEIRARANCLLGRGTTYSSSLEGTIDRTSIGPFGRPSPSDGFLRLGQDISVTFDGDIECNPASYAILPDIRLIRTDNMTAIPFTIQCSENEDRIILQPTVDLFNMPSLEGVEILAHVMGIEDENGNTQEYPIDWSFEVNASPVFWDPAVINQKGTIGQSNVLEARLKNQAVITKAFEITDYPVWLTPSNLSGSILANGEYELQFAVDPELPPGLWKDTVVAMVDGWPELLEVNYESLAIPPNWVVNPTKFNYSMNMVLAFSLDQTNTNLSRDNRDMIAAIYNGEVRGVTRLEYVAQFNKYLAFLTVYSNIPANEKITFSMWRASTGVEHRAKETFYFANEQVYGRIGAPEVLHPDGVFQVIPLKQGWNWVSFNITNSDMTIHNMLSSLASDEKGNNITVKRKDGNTATFTQIATPIIYANQWAGNLYQLDNKQAYLIHLSDSPDTLRVPGQPITNFSKIGVFSGWNWIGFQPQSAQPILQALSSVNLRNKDLLKGQEVFSEYHKGSQTWYGPLQFMEPGKGYKLRLRSGVTYNDLQYSRLGIEDFEVDHTQFESSMTIIGSVGLSEGSELESGSQRLLVGAFIDDTCRGYGFLEYVEFMKEYRVIFSMHGNASDIGRPVIFKLYDTQSGQEFTPANEPEFFVTDRILGEMMDPYVLFESLELPEAGYFLDQSYPNPFGTRTNIRFILPQDEHVTLYVYDQMGKRVATPIDGNYKQGEHTIIFDAKDLPSGMYHYKMEAGDFSASRKMVKF